jgi:glucan phosphoethanolaminetransferase (alkaline phosphatase superfamily)
MILDIIFQNDMMVSADMITIQLIVWSLLITCIGYFIASLRKKYTVNFNKVTTYIIISTGLILSTILLNPNERFARPICERIPFNIFNVITKYISQHQEIAIKRPQQCSYANITTNDSTIVVIVIGEALRPSNMSINGYQRNTTPNLEKLNVISLDSIFSDFVYTNRSIPHLMTRATTENPEIAYSERSFIDIFKKAGIHTATIANQDAEKPYIYFIEEADTVIKSNQSKTVYNFDKWLDEDILPHYNRILNKNFKHQLVVIHTIGSHWWYNAHYSSEYEKFAPTMQSRIVSNCDSIEIVNSYDNTVLYTDYIISEIIKPLLNKNAIMIYISDHGEALGENNMWLHANESEIMHHTAALVWMSDRYKSNNKTKHSFLLQKQHKKQKTDFVYHSVIDAANIKTDVIDKELSIFR